MKQGFWHRLGEIALVCAALFFASVGALVTLYAMKLTVVPPIIDGVVKSADESWRPAMAVLAFSVGGIVLAAILWAIYKYLGNRLHAMRHEWGILEWIIFGYDVYLVLLFPVMGRMRFSASVEVEVTYWSAIVCLMYVGARSMRLAVYLYRHQVLQPEEGLRQNLGLLVPYISLGVAFVVYMSSPDMYFSTQVWKLFVLSFFAATIAAGSTTAVIPHLQRAAPLQARETTETETVVFKKAD